MFRIISRSYLGEVPAAGRAEGARSVTVWQMRALDILSMLLKFKLCEKRDERSSQSVTTHPGYLLRCAGIPSAGIAAVPGGHDHPLVHRRAAGECLPQSR